MQHLIKQELLTILPVIFHLLTPICVNFITLKTPTWERIGKIGGLPLKPFSKLHPWYNITWIGFLC